jgi:hypothetical protein
MNRNPLAIIFAGLLIAAAIFAAVTTNSLPDPIAITFSAGGLAHNYMSHSAYRIYLLLCTIVMPLVIVLAIDWLPRLSPNRINIPHRDYWLAPQHRAQTLFFLRQHALRFGCLFVIFMVGIQWLVIQANTLNPPRLANGPFIILLVGFLISIGIWILVIFRRFRRPF